MLATTPVTTAAANRYLTLSGGQINLSHFELSTMPELSTAKDIAAIAAPFTAAVVETWLKPKLATLLRKHRTKRALIEHGFASSFTEYLERAYVKYSFLNVLVFQNQARLLEDLYVPVRLRRSGARSDVLVDDYRDDLIPKHRKILLTDTAGMGKSTLLRFLFLRAVTANRGIPIFIELRKLSAKAGVVELLLNELANLGEEVDGTFVYDLIRNGHFVFFMDGYDEIPFSEREMVTRDLQEFIAKARGNHFIMASRPESALASFTDFVEFSVQPLTRDEAFSVIRRYDPAGVVATALIAKLEQPKLHNIREFLTNPLMVSLLFKSFEYKPTVPIKKHVFYRQVYDALFEAHDLTKPGAFVREKHSGLDSDDFHRVLRAFGYITMKVGQIEYSKDELLGFLERAATLAPGIRLKAGSFFKDILTTVPLFVRDGAQYRWSHKSIQEYFAAQFISADSKDDQTLILRKMVANEHSTRYRNVLDMCYDMDYPTFRQSVIYDICVEFLHYHDRVGAFPPHVLVDADDSLAIRKSITFKRKLVLGVKPLLDADHPLEDDEVSDTDDVTLMFASEWNSGLTFLQFGDLAFESLLDLLFYKGDPIVWRPSRRQEVTEKIQSVLEAANRVVILSDTLDDLLSTPDLLPDLASILSDEPLELLSAPQCRKVVEEIDLARTKSERENWLLEGL